MTSGATGRHADFVDRWTGRRAAGGGHEIETVLRAERDGGVKRIDVCLGDSLAVDAVILALA
jgi:hypothetical protein